MRVVPTVASMAALLALAISLPAGAEVLDIPRPEAPPQPGHDAASGLPLQPVLQAGTAVPLSLVVQASDWQDTGKDMAEWRLTLESADAHFLGLRFDHPELPEGASLSLLGADGQAHGPYGQDDINARGQLWVPPVHGSRAELVLRAPSTLTGGVRLDNAELHYGLHPIDGVAQTKAQGDAGDCHNDVVCQEGNAWGSAVRSTALLIIGNQLICSGVLLNTTRGDGDPLLVTADQCGIRADDDSSGFTADSVTAVFNFQSRACGGNARIDQSDRISGETLLYRDEESDTALIRLAQTPPDAFGVAFAGWDASGSGARSGAGVHHPAGDLKKISLFGEPLGARRVLITDGARVMPRNQEVESWEVIWSNGVTEPGSSGSSIWNPQQRLLGVLSGGRSACGTDGLPLLGIGATRENPGPDFYGRLAVAFDSDGELGTPLRAFLDPSGSGAVRANARGGAPASSLGGGEGSSGGGMPLIMLALLGAASLGRRLRQRGAHRP